jgi:hypothetical protein
LAKRIPILEGSKYGTVSGEIIITPKSKASPKDLAQNPDLSPFKGVTLMGGRSGISEFLKSIEGFSWIDPDKLMGIIGH